LKAVQATVTALLAVLLLGAVALPALAAQQGPVSVENVLVTCYHDAEFRSGVTTTLQIKAQNEAGHAWSSVQVRVDPEETSYLSPRGTNIVDFQSLAVGESRTEDKVVNVADTAPAGEYHFNLYVRLDGGEWTFLMRVTMHNAGPGVDPALVALAIGIAALLGAVALATVIVRGRSRAPRRRQAVAVPPAKKLRPGKRPKIVSVRPRGEAPPAPGSAAQMPEIVGTEEEAL